MSFENSSDLVADHTPPDQRGTALRSHLRLLCVGSVEPSWVTLALRLDAEGCHEPSLKWVSTSAEALALLRDESYDCLLIRENNPEAASKRTFADRNDDSIGNCESMLLVQGIRAGGCDDPVMVVIPAANDHIWTEACRLHADLLVTPGGWESQALVPAIRRAIERAHMGRENHRLETADRRRLLRERDEAEYLLGQQRQIIQELEQLTRVERSSDSRDSSRLPAAGKSTAVARVQLPAEFDEYYQELLRTYVIMGSGTLGAEIAKLAELLAVAGLSPRQALEMHVQRVEQLVRGLGNRSTRHVMARADLLALELMIHLGECYQRKSHTPSLSATLAAISETAGIEIV